MAKDKLLIKNLNLSFGSTHVLKDISMAIPKNKVVALIGPSGSGKSTLLRCINRLHDLYPDAHITGEIFLDKQDIYAPKADIIETRRRIGMVFQRPNPFPKSIYENIAYGLKIGGEYRKKVIQKKVEGSLRGSYLWNEVSQNLEKSALALSGGQQQRLCISRTIAVEPEVILMDEPCSALDPISTAKVEELILELKKKYTVIIVTHNMQQAERVADFTAFMHLGELVEYELTDKIFKHPQKELTHKYLEGSYG